MKFSLLFLISFLCSAAILPESLGQAHRTSAVRPVLTDQSLWEEYGLQDAEQATYHLPDRDFTVAAYRLQDATAALAAFQWQRPSDGQPTNLSKLAVETAAGLTLEFGNYLLVFAGYKPGVPELNALFGALPSLENGPLPTLPDYLPAANHVPNSERYVTGPVSLQKFAPQISPSAAGFHLGAEAEVGLFHTPGGELKLALFSYPTFEIARDRLAQFEKIPAVMAKRTGPLVAIVLAPLDPNEAEKLLSQVHYQAAVTVNQHPPTKRDNFANLLLNIFLLVGVIVVFFIVAGLAFGGLRMILRRSGPAGDGEPMITLHLTDRERIG